MAQATRASKKQNLLYEYQHCLVASADSIPTGDRSRWYLYLYVFGTLAGVVGPIITVFGFMYWGNDWTLPELRKVCVCLCEALLRLVKYGKFAANVLPYWCN